MCNVHDPRILNAYISITENELTDWLILGYNDTKDVISLYSCGERGLSEFRENIILNEILFGFVRVDEKFLLITFIPDSVSGVRRARALVHSRTVAGILELSHAQMTASSLSDLSDMNIRTRLKLEPINRPKSRSSSFIQQRRRKSGASSSYYSPSPSPVIFGTTDDDEDTLSTITTLPSTPTFNEPASPLIFVIDPSSFSEEPKRLHETTTELFKKSVEESRFKLFQKEHNIMKRIEEEQKRIKLQQKEERVIPQWQVELQQRKKKKQELRKIQSLQQIPSSPASHDKKRGRPKSIHLDHPPLPTEPKVFKEEIKSVIKSTSQLEEKVLPSNTTPMTDTTKKAGFIAIQVNHSPFWKRRYYTVDKHCMLLYKDETCKERLYEIKFSDTLRISLIDEDEEVYVPNSFMIETYQKELYQLLADDKKEFKALYTTLKNIV